MMLYSLNIFSCTVFAINWHNMLVEHIVAQFLSYHVEVTNRFWNEDSVDRIEPWFNRIYIRNLIIVL